MMRDLPSLNAVRMFEAAARHLNFTRAGEELNVTQGAVSRQIKLLEEQLGCKLFHRNGPNLKLSESGEEFQVVVDDSLAIIRRGTTRLRRRASSAIITVSILPSFASKWLLGRLSSLEKMHPDISLHLAASYKVVNFALDSDVDVAIRIGKGEWPGVYVAQITEGEMFPVCAPELAKTIKRPEDILNHRLIMEVPPYDEWHRWFEFAGLSFSPDGARVYDDTTLLVQGAIEGQGVSLCRKEFIEDCLESGCLVKPLDISIVSEYQYYFVCPQERLKESSIRALHDWMLQA